MSDVTSPKKRPQRPAAPLWAARRRPRPEPADARGNSEPEERASQIPAETRPAPPALAAPPRVPRPVVAPRPAFSGSSGAATPEPAAPPPPPPAPGAPPATASEQPEAVSLREIETMLSPGKLPPRLPATSARDVRPSPPRDPRQPLPRGVAAGRGAPTFAKPTARSPVPPPRAPESPPSTVERPLPNPLEASAADLELMAMLAAVPSKRPIEAKPAWAPPKAPAQAKASTVRVLSSEAAAALKGERPAAPGPMRSPTLRSTAVQVERPAPAPAGKGRITVPPPPPIRLSPPSAPDAVSGEVDDSAWDLPDEAPAPAARPVAASQTRAVDALQMRAGTRGGSLPDPVELLRDAPDSAPPVMPTGRGSVVDPLELYGAITPPAPAAPKPPEQSLPKVMVQVPAKAPAAGPSGPWAGAAPGGPAARTAEALAEAETRAERAAAEANAAAFRPRVDLPARAEPKPLPKPPPRTRSPVTMGPQTPGARLEPRRPEPKPAEARPVVAPPPPPPPVPGAPISAQPISVEPADDDEIAVDVAFDTPEPAEAAPSPSRSHVNPDSGRFDLQQLMAGPGAPKSSPKGLGDADLFDLAGDLFTDPAAPKLAPPDLAALGKTSGPASARLLAPVALGTAPDAAAAPIARPSTASPVAARASEPPPRSRAIAPWIALPVAALVAAGVMVVLGRSPTTSATNAPPPSGSAAEQTAPPPPVSSTPSAPASASTSAPEAAEKPASSKPPSDATPPGPVTAWKPPSSLAPAASTGPAAPATAPSAPPAPTQTAPPAPTQTAPPAPTAPPPSGNEFNQSAAKAALRNAAGAAAGCPTDKPGVASVSITFAPSGRVTSANVSGAFAGTPTGGCIASAMRSASVPAFDGGPVSVVWKVTLR